MVIRTQESFSGFVASDPQLSRTSTGEARLYARVGQEHYRRFSTRSSYQSSAVTMFRGN